VAEMAFPLQLKTSIFRLFGYNPAAASVSVTLAIPDLRFTFKTFHAQSTLKLSQDSWLSLIESAYLHIGLVR